MIDEDDDAADKALIGDKLRAARVAAHLTLQGVARESGGRYKASVIGMYERGKRSVSAARLAGLARFYKVDVATLLPAATELEAFVDRLTTARTETLGALANVPAGTTPFAPNILRRVDFLLARLITSSTAPAEAGDPLLLEEALA